MRTETIIFAERMKNLHLYLKKNNEAIIKFLFPVPDEKDSAETYADRFNRLPEQFPGIDMKALSCMLEMGATALEMTLGIDEERILH